jgi:hypothetical protein
MATASENKTNGSGESERGGVWSRVESARGALVDQGRHVTQVAGRSLTAAQQRAVGTVREKPVTTGAVLTGVALLVAGAVFAARNPRLIKGAASFLTSRLRSRF